MHCQDCIYILRLPHSQIKHFLCHLFLFTTAAFTILYRFSFLSLTHSIWWCHRFWSPPHLRYHSLSDTFNISEGLSQYGASALYWCLAPFCLFLHLEALPVYWCHCRHFLCGPHSDIFIHLNSFVVVPVTFVITFLCWLTFIHSWNIGIRLISLDILDIPSLIAVDSFSHTHFIHTLVHIHLPLTYILDTVVPIVDTHMLSVSTSHIWYRDSDLTMTSPDIQYSVMEVYSRPRTFTVCKTLTSWRWYLFTVTPVTWPRDYLGTSIGLTFDVNRYTTGDVPDAGDTNVTVMPVPLPTLRYRSLSRVAAPLTWERRCCPAAAPCRCALPLHSHRLPKNFASVCSWCLLPIFLFRTWGLYGGLGSRCRRRLMEPPVQEAILIHSPFDGRNAVTRYIRRYICTNDSHSFTIQYSLTFCDEGILL